MEEIEVHNEHMHEQIQEKTEEQKEKWVLYVALSTRFMAVPEAIAGLLAGHHANEALIERVKASDSWSFYQSKNLKEEIASITDKILRSLSPTPPKEDNSVAIARYEKEKGEIKKTAEEAEKSSEGHLSRHVPLATAVTCFQIAIAISAIAILTKKGKLCNAGMLLPS